MVIGTSVLTTGTAYAYPSNCDAINTTPATVTLTCGAGDGTAQLSVACYSSPSNRGGRGRIVVGRPVHAGQTSTVSCGSGYADHAQITRSGESPLRPGPV